MIRDLVLRNRSYRRFQQAAQIGRQTLVELVDLARCSASGGNLQPLKYILSCDQERNTLIFPCLGWARYLKDWPGPAEGERPSGYIVVLGDKRVTQAFGCDHGIAAQSILLGAVEQGYGGCIIASINREQLRRALEIPEHFDILIVIALGVPAEEVILEEVGPEGEIQYWRDAAGQHHVPKRRLNEIILG